MHFEDLENGDAGVRIEPGPLKTFLLSGAPCFKADLFTYTLANGAVYRYGTFDIPISYGGHTWSSAGPLMSRSQLSVRNTVEVPQLTMRLLPRAVDLINGKPMKEQLINGFFDGAVVQLERAFMATPGDTSLGLILMFAGRHSKAESSGSGVMLTAKGDNVLMNQNAPKNLYQTTCLHNFCDAGCTLSAAANSISNTVGIASNRSQIVWGSLPGAPAIYTQGVITFTSGPNDGAERSVQVSASSGIYLDAPLDSDPVPGDTFSILRGCDKTSATCTALANLQHYRGFEFVPPAEMAV